MGMNKATDEASFLNNLAKKTSKKAAPKKAAPKKAAPKKAVIKEIALQEIAAATSSGYLPMPSRHPDLSGHLRREEEYERKVSQAIPRSYNACPVGKLMCKF